MMTRRVALIAAWIAAGGQGWLAHAQTETPEQYTVNVYWTETPPSLDGQMDESCWEEAQCVRNFRLFQKPTEAAAQQTEVRVCYDAENLYVFWKLNEARMDKLFYGPPEDMRDMLNFSGDVAELFLDPGKTREAKIQLCASPLGTRYDSSGKKGAHFNPEWTAKPGVFKDHWTLEAAVPFTELVHKGEYLGTPQVGDEWGIQFCRDQAHLHEWSQWKPTPRGFHEVDKFGTAVFSGRKNGAPLPAVKRVSEDLLTFGPGALQFTVAGAGQKTALEYTILHAGKPATRKTDALAAVAYQVPYHIMQGGTWDARVTFREGEKPFYMGRVFNVLAPVRKILETIDRNVRLARTSLTNFRHPAAPGITASLERLEEAARVPHAKMALAETLSRADWEAVVASVQHLDALWKALRFDLHLIQLYPKSETVRAFTVADAGPEEKVYEDSLLDGDRGAPIRVSAAGGEVESFQLAVVPFWRDLDAVTVEASELRAGNGTIPAGQVTFRLVDYVRLEGVDPDDLTMHEREPDILWPAKPFPVSKGKVRSVWVDVHVPRGTPEGDYEGTVTVKAAGQEVARALQVHSYGFDLPMVASLENNFWFGPTDYGWGRFYGAGHYGDKDYPPELYEQHAEILSRYRVTCFADSVLTMDPHFTIHREPDGRFSFDFSAWERFIRIGLKCGSNAYRASLSCNLGAMYLFREYTTVIDRETGKEQKMSEVIGDWLAAKKAGEAYWDTHPVYRDYLKAYIAFMKRVGVFDMASWEIYDEPNSNPRWLDMIRHHKFLRDYVPELTLTNYGMDPLQRKSGKTALGLIDIWAPQLTEITPESLQVMADRRRTFGEKFWFYTCGERRDKDGNLSPFLYYHRSYLGPRIHGWFAWKLKVDGMLIYAMNDVPESDVKVKNRDQQWPNSEWLDGKSRGCGVLIYPGPDYELIPSMRLASVRDGLEDYEYFHELHTLLAYLDTETNGELRAAVEQELEIEDNIIKSHHVWTKNRHALEAKRDRLAALIRRCRQVVAER